MKEPEAYIIDGQTISKDELFTPVEAQAYLEIGDQQMWRWRTTGHLDFVKLYNSNSMLYTKKQLDEALALKRPERDAVKN